MNKRIAPRGSSTKPVPKGKPFIVGDDFLGILDSARKELARQLEPKKAGRPKMMMKEVRDA